MAGAFLFAGCEKEKKKTTFEHIDVTELFPCHFKCFDTIKLVNDNATLKKNCPDAPDVDLCPFRLSKSFDIKLSGMAGTGMDYAAYNNTYFGSYRENATACLTERHNL